jgi:hypothetical protein
MRRNKSSTGGREGRRSFSLKKKTEEGHEVVSIIRHSFVGSFDDDDGHRGMARH